MQQGSCPDTRREFWTAQAAGHRDEYRQRVTMIELIALGLIAAPFAAASLLLLLLLIDVLVRRADITAALLMGSTLMDAFFANAVPSLTLPGDIRVGSTDVIATLVLCAAFARLLRVRRLSTYQRWLVLFVLLLVLSLVRGVIAFGIQTSVSDFRLMEFWIAAAVYFATVPPSHLVYDRIAKLWVWMTVPLMAIVLARWMAVFAGIDVGVPRERFGSDAAIRVLDGPYTFFLAQGFILTLPFWRQDQRARSIRIVSVMLLLFVVLLDRRTAWVALLAGIITLMLHDRRLGRRAMWAVVTILGIFVGAYSVLRTAITSGEPIARATFSTASVTWRIEGWAVLLSQWASSPANWFTGEPFGASFLRRIEGSDVVAGPHNFYIEILLRTGVFGLLALLALTVGLLVATWGRSTEDAGVFGSGGVLPALLMMQLIWFVTWVPGIEQGIVTGIAISFAAHPAIVRPPQSAVGMVGGRSTHRIRV
jgi:O-Antigen ligase